MQFHAAGLLLYPAGKYSRESENSSLFPPVTCRRRQVSHQPASAVAAAAAAAATCRVYWRAQFLAPESPRHI